MPVMNSCTSVVTLERYTSSNMTAMAPKVNMVILARLAFPMMCMSSESAAGPVT